MWKWIKERISKISILRSLRVRIFVLLVLVGIVPSAIMGIVFLQNYQSRAINVRMAEISNQFRIIANHLVTNNYLQDMSSEAINAELEQLSNLYDGRVLIINGNFKVMKDTYGISEGKTIISEEVIRCFRGQDSSRYNKEEGYIEMTIPIGENTTENWNVGEAELLEEQNPVKGVMLTSVSTDGIAMTRSVLSRRGFLVELLMGIIIVGMSLGISYLLIKPFSKVTKAIGEVREGLRTDALSVPDYEETEHIVTAFNQVLSRMRVLDESRQEFVSNVSHELKTPLTSMKVLADSLLMQEDVPLELYQEFMADIAAEIDRENKIITDLLSLVKLDKTKGELNISAVDINELLELIMKRLRPIAAKQDVELTLESVRPVTAEVDEVKLTLAFSNLVENAVKYNREHGFVHVTVDADHQFFTLQVADSGIGIPESDYEHIFERFYRVDKSHSREIGGTGLGLAITRSVILMHRGAISVQSKEGEGTTFTVRIPLNYQSN